ncbi:MAG: phosphoribosyltransferase [Chloroflexi bacterium]|nr:phosphoribosyltransferase [Chloroflexota bacterium]
MAIYRDRLDAGRRLAEHLQEYAGRQDVLVLALPRGGVPVGYEVARALSAPLDVFVVRKLGTPGQPELAMGAIATGGVRVLNPDVLRVLHISEATIEAVTRRELQELERRERMYRGDRSPVDVKGRIVILVDDGLATGATMRAAVQALRQQGPQKIVVAVPTASPDVCREFESIADQIVCAAMPVPFYAVGASYERFDQMTDQEVREYLEKARRPTSTDGQEGTCAR